MRDFLDYDNDELLMPQNDDYAIDAHGHMYQRVSDHEVYDLRTGELHFTSGWEQHKEADDISFFDDDNDAYEYNYNRASSGSRSSYRSGNYSSSGNGSSTSSWMPPTPKGSDSSGGGIGCAGMIALVLGIVFVIGTVKIGDMEGFALAFAAIIAGVILIVISLLMSGKRNERKAHAGYGAEIAGLSLTEREADALKSREAGQKQNSAPKKTKMDTKDRKILILYIVVGVLACALLTLLVMHLSSQPPEEAAETPSPTSTPKPAVTPEPTPSPTPEPIKIDETQTNIMINDILERLNDPLDYLLEYSEKMWVEDEVFITHDDIVNYQKRWTEYDADLSDMLEVIDSVSVTNCFSLAWMDLYGYVKSLEKLAETLSDMDVDGDGTVSDEECGTANHKAMRLSDRAEEYIVEMSDDYSAAYALWKTVTPSPRPTATPGRTTTTQRSSSNIDPYYAKDYSHPDDFYYDYYDDFLDYEDAEEYWEEHNGGDNSGTYWYSGDDYDEFDWDDYEDW